MTETGTIPEALRHQVFEAEDELWTAEDLMEAAYVLFESTDAPFAQRRREAIMRVLTDAKLAVEAAHERWREIDAIVKGEPLDDGNGDIEPAAGGVGPAKADDTRLIGLGQRLCVAMMHEKAAGGDDVSQDEHDAAIALCRALAKEISVTHTTTIAGLRAKALAVEWICDDDAMDKRPAIETLIADVRAVAATA